MSGSTMIVNLSRRSGGAERRIVEQCRRWDGPHDLHVVHLGGAELGRALRDVPSCQLHPLDRSRWNPLIVVDLVRLMRAERVQVVDAHNVVAQLWSVLAGRLARVPRIFCTVHSDYRNEHHGSRRAGFYSTVVRAAGWMGARFIAVESRVAEFIETCGVAPRQILVIPNAAVERVATPDARQVIRAELGLAEEFMVVFAGRLEPVKQIETLLRSFHHHDVVTRDIHLVVAGEGSQRTALETLAADLHLNDRIHFLGHRNDVIDVIAASDCVALVSSSEGLPYVVLEAVALGRPLVLTRLPVLVDLLAGKGAQGENGAEFIDVGDSVALAHAIARLAGDDLARAHLATTARTAVSARLPPSHLPLATMAAYEGLHRPRDILRSIRPDGAGFDRLFGSVRRVAPFVARPTRDLSVLTYHRVATDEHDQHLDPVLRSATPDMFEEHMAMIRDRYQPVTMLEAQAALIDGASLPRGAVLVTFDDAYRDVAEHAAPVLKRHGISSTIFVPTAYPGSDHRDYWWDRLYRSILHSSNPMLNTPLGTFALDRTPTRSSWVANMIARHLKTLNHVDALALVEELIHDAGTTDTWNAVMNWDQLGDLVAAGHSVQSHTRTHPALDQLSVPDVDAELKGSSSDILEHLGVAPTALAYPTGQSSPAVREVIADAGFRLAFTTLPGVNRLPSEDPLSLRRLDVTGAVRTTHLAAMLGPIGSAALRMR